MDKKISIKKMIIKLLIGVLFLLLFFVVIYLILKHFGYADMNQEQLQELIKKAGVYGKIVFVTITFLQVTFIPIPSAVTILSGLYLYGFWKSFFLSFIGLFLGSMFAFFLGRKIGRKFVDWAMGSKEETDYYLSKLKGKETVLLFFMFVLPAFPDDALCAVAGITNINKWVFTVMQVITRPVSILGTLIFMSGMIIPFEGLGLVLIILIAIISIIAFIIVFKNSDRINNSLEKISLKITNKFKKK